jgi:hypothetical protein
VVRDHVVSLAYAFGSVPSLLAVVAALGRCLEGCRLNRRNAAPNTCDRLRTVTTVA